MEKILSVIVPTYNMEKYLQRCLDSFLVKDKFKEILEVLVVNDGSKDSSYIIAHEYQSRFPALFRVLDKENGNYGSCVNRGLHEIKGRYVKIVDADDWVDTIALESVLKYLKQNMVDMLLTMRCIIYEKEEVKREDPLFSYPQNQILPFSVFVEKDKRYSSCQMHWIIYRTDILFKMNYKQTEGISYTDAEWTYIPMSSIQTFSYLPVFLYNYAIGREGQTVNPSVMARSNGQNLIVIKNLVDAYIKFFHDADKHHQKYLRDKLHNQIVYLYSRYLLTAKSDTSDLIEFDRKLKTIPEINEDLTNLRGPYKIKLIDIWRKHSYKLPYYITLYYNICKALTQFKSC